MKTPPQIRAEQCTEQELEHINGTLLPLLRDLRRKARQNRGQ